MGWLVHVAGWLQHKGFRSGDGNSWTYLFWSGFGTYVISVLIYLCRNNCEVHRCWWLSRHTTAGGHHVCRHHHPHGAPPRSTFTTPTIAPSAATPLVQTANRPGCTTPL